MKKLILTLSAIFLISISVFSQDTTRIFKKEDLPQFYVQNGQTIGMILSIEQVQKLDNDTDLLLLLEKMELECDSLSQYYVAVVNEQGRKIYLLELQVSNLLNQGEEKDKLINNLKEQVANKVISEGLSQTQIGNLNKINEGLQDDLRKANFQKTIAWGTTGLAAAAAILLSIFLVK